MSQDNDALQSAVDDVNSVANALRELREKIHAYGEAATRLDKVSDALVQLSDGVASMRTGIESIVQRAEKIDATLVKSHLVVETMTASIPDVIDRIEASDNSKSIADFTKLLDEVRDVVRNQEDTTLGMRTVIEGFSGISTELRNIKESSIQPPQMLQLLNQVVMQIVAGPVSENTRLLGELKIKLHGIEAAATKSVEDEAAFRQRLANEIEVIHTEIDKLHGEPLKVIELMKGFNPWGKK